MNSAQPPPMDEQTLRLRQILDSSPALIHTGKPDGSLDFFNQRWCEFVGKPVEELQGWLWTTCVHPDDIGELLEKWRDSIATGNPLEVESRVRRADGEFRWMLHQKIAQRSADGAILQWHGSSIDIEARKQVEQSLRKNTEELQTNKFFLSEAQRLGHMGSWSFDPAEGFDHWSPELFQIHGLEPSPEAPTLETYLALVHPEDRAFMASLMERMRVEAFPFDVTKRIVRSDGHLRYVRCVGSTAGETGSLKRVGVGIDVTEHELLTQELRRREASLTDAQRLSHTGSFGWKPGCEEHVWSDETFRIFEYDPAARITLDMVVERVHPEDRGWVLELIRQAAAGGVPIDCEYRLLFPGDRIKHVHVLARPLGSSEDLEFAGAVIDITDAKRAEENTRRSERELRTLVEAIPAYVGTALPDGSVDFISQSWLDYTGFSSEQGEGWGWADVIHPEDLGRVMNSWRAAVTTGAPVEHELRCRRTDGTYHWFLYRSLPLHDDGGNVVKWYGTLTNIDALKETESALQTREHELLGIIETIPSMLWSASPTGDSTHLSQRLLEYFGVPFEQFVHRGWERFIHPDDREETAKAFLRAMETGESYNAINRLRRGDGEYRRHHTRGEPLRDPQGKIIQWYGLSVDIDELKRAEDHLRDTRTKLSTASRIATVAELSASIAHQLNQPLMAISGNAQAARRWLAATPPNELEALTAIERILRDVQGADQAMQRIRALFKQGPYEKSEERVLGIIRESVRFIDEDPNKWEAQIDWSLADNLPLIYVDRIQIQQVLINLISNAIEATQDNAESSKILLNAFVNEKDEIVIQVIDNGSGLEDTETIFDAFMTTKEKGMGIGLAVSKSIVEAHGGRLWAENNSGLPGATFNVALPVATKRNAG